MSPTALFVDDDRASTESLVRALVASGFAAECRTTGAAAEALILARDLRPSVAVIDLSLDPHRGVESGFALLVDLLAIVPDCRIIVLTGHGSTEYGIRALNLGATNFLEKPADIGHLAALLRDGIAQAKLRRDYAMLADGTAFRSIPIVGDSPAIRPVIDAIRFAASTAQPVLLTGETGTGKGVLARAIHTLSPRAGHRFVRYQPTFATPDLVQSDLFGHVRGAFTGASTDRTGLIAEADGGTLFLDEVDELPPEIQVALLGVLQEKRFRPVGSSHEIASNFRLVCASNRDLEEAVSSKKLRADLFHRINHVTIRVPPLRERRPDIPALVSDIVQRLAETAGLDVLGIEPDALNLLAEAPWRGNVRELEAVVEGAAYRARFAGRNRIALSDMSLPSVPAAPGNAADFHSRVEEYKRTLVDEALARNGGNQLRAAAELGLDRGTLARILKGR
jgi:two-component system response regulator HydG